MSNLSIEIAATGLNAQQAGMDAVSQNLANASTPGYVAETAVLTPNPSATMLGAGSGVRVAGIAQVPAQLAQVANQQAQASLAQATARQQVLTQVQNAFPEPNNGQGISNQLANFWSSWDAINQNPSSPAPYTQVVDQASGLATSLNQAAAAITQTATDAQSQLSATVTTDNALLSQVASLNSQISAVAASGASPNSLIDQQNQLVSQLATDLGVTATAQPGGGVDLAVGGFTLVQGNVATQLAVQTKPASSGATSPTYAVLDTTNNLPLTGLSGTAGGLVTTLNSDLPQYQAQLNQVASALATSVNHALTNGTTTAGTTGQPLFVVSGQTTAPTSGQVTAANIAVNATVVTSPTTTLAVSSTGGGAGNGANAQAIAEAGSATTFPPNADYTNFIQSLGTQVQSANGQVTAETSVANAASQNLQEIAGVNTNQQMVDLLNYQHAFQASAQVVATVNSAIQSLLQAV